MSNEDAEFLKNKLSKTLIHFVEKRDKLNKTTLKVMKTSLEMLSRLTIRMNGQELNELLRKLMKVYQSGVLRDPGDSQILRNAFKRTLRLLPEQFIVENLENLGTLNPHLANVDITVIEPLLYIRNLRKIDLQETIFTDQWKEMIFNTISAVGCDNHLGRKIAIKKIEVLNKYGLLNNNQISEFKNKLWSNVDDGTFDSDFSGKRDILLLLPERTDGEAIFFLKKKLLKLDFTDLILGDQRPISNKYDNLYELISSTIPRFNYFTKKDIFIDWTKEEACVIAKKFISWWESQKNLIPKLQKSELCSNELSVLIDLTIYCIAFVLLPHANKFKGSQIRKIVEISSKLKNMGFQTMRLDLFKVFLDSAEIERLSSSLEVLLRGNTSSDCLEAVYIWSWASNPDINTRIPEKTLIAFSEAIRFALNSDLLSFNSKLNPPEYSYQESSVETRIDYLSNIVKNCSYLITEGVIKTITDSIQFIKSEIGEPLLSDYPPKNLNYDLDKAISTMISTVRLSVTMKSHLENNGQKIPTVLQELINIAKSSPLPELRKATILTDIY